MRSVPCPHLVLLLVLYLQIARGFSVGRVPARFHSKLVMSKGGKVCVVGGGLAGLVSGKECLKAGLRPTIFESAKAVGGMWNPALSRCYESLTTNLSKFTCAFSDFPWPAKSPLFPSQGDVGRYLMGYKDEFLSDAEFQTGCRVTAVQPKDGKFEVSWTDEGQVIQTADFDKVIVASGFFASQVVPTIEGIDSFTGTCIHSGDYRSPSPFEGKRVAVVGSSFSSAEIAAEIAPVASSVINIMPKRSWIVPRFIPSEPQSPSTAFIPLDLLLYRRRQGEKKEDYSLRKSEYLRSLFGSTERDPLHAFRAPTDSSDPPFVGVCDTYGNLCRSGQIVPVQGRLSRVDGSSCVVSQAAENESAQTLRDIDAIVLCTGFKPDLCFLSEQVLLDADYQAHDSFCPLRLYDNVVHPTLHGLAFVGMYRGPYFGVTEMQAKLAASVFTEQVRMPEPAAIEANLHRITRIRDQDPRPQFPFPDYIGLMDSLAETLHAAPAAACMQPGQSVIPAHYGSAASAEEASAQLELELELLRGGGRLAATIARSLHGSWRFERQLTSRLQGTPSGTVAGEIEFVAKRGGAVEEEDLDYMERGVFQTPFGKFDVSAQYLYAYNAAEDALDVYFGPPDPRKERLFVRLRFEREATGWRAVAEHRCGEDDYDADYHFAFDGLTLREIVIKFKVVGPSKDYSSVTVLTR